MLLAMKSKFDKYWKICNNILVVACFLDPHYKMRAIGVYFKEIYGNEYQKHVDEIASVIKNYFSAYACSIKFQNGENRFLAIENVVEQCGEKRKSRYEQVIVDEVEP